MSAPVESRASSQMGASGKVGSVRRWRPSRREAWLGYIFVAPAMIAILAVSLYPVIDTLWLSLRDGLLGATNDKFVGLANYIDLFNNPSFTGAWVHTMVFTVTSVLLETLLGTVIALVMYQTFPGRGLLRALVLIPWVIPTVVTSRLFGWLFDGQTGLVNSVLRSLGIIHENINFLGSTTWAMPTIIAADVWKTTPFMALLILAGLQTIPASAIESAKIDGASSLRIFFSVRLPLILPPLLIAVLLRALDAVRIFDLPYVLTGGGPAGSTETLSTVTYKQFFAALQVGQGSAMATATFITEAAVAGIFAIVIVRAYKRTGDQR